MSNLENWFKNQKKHKENFISIHNFIFCKEEFNYIAYRLKAFNLKQIIHYLFFCSFFIISYKTLMHKTLNIIIFIVLVQLIVFSFWWGALEYFRDKIRNEFYFNDAVGIAITLGNYLKLTITISILFSIISILFWYEYIYLSVSINFLSKTISLYLLLQISFSLFIRTYHSGIYAITRVVRKPFSIIAPDLIGLIILILINPFFSEYASFISILVRSVISNILTLHFSFRMYEFYEIYPKFINFKQWICWLKNIKIYNMMLPGLSFVFLKADMVLIALTIFFMENNIINNELFAILFLTIPMFKATTDCALLFYFDRKKIVKNDFKKIVDLYDQQISKNLIFFSLFYWILSLLAVTNLIYFSTVIYSLMLLPIFLLKAKISNIYVKKFSYNFYYDIIFMNIIICISICSIYFLSFSLVVKYCIFLFVIILITKTLMRKNIFQNLKFKYKHKKVYNIYLFLWLLIKKSHKNLYIYCINTTDYINNNQFYALIKYLSFLIHHDYSEICHVSNKNIMFFIEKKYFSKQHIFKKYAGLIKSIQIIETKCIQDVFSFLWYNEYLHNFIDVE